MRDRNALCPCGSGRKHKNCCARKRSPRTQWIAIASVVLFVALGAWVVGGVMMDPKTYEQPAQVWSEEHGHFHDGPGAVDHGATEVADTSVSEAAATDAAAPSGKVWSDEHGHYHDAPASADGLDHAWSEEHGHWHHAPQWSEEHGHFHQPPEELDEQNQQIWSAEHGHFHDAPETIELDGMTLERMGAPPDITGLTKVTESTRQVTVGDGEGDAEATSDQGP